MSVEHSNTAVPSRHTAPRETDRTVPLTVSVESYKSPVGDHATLYSPQTSAQDEGATIANDAGRREADNDDEHGECPKAVVGQGRSAPGARPGSAERGERGGPLTCARGRHTQSPSTTAATALRAHAARLIQVAPGRKGARVPPSRGPRRLCAMASEVPKSRSPSGAPCSAGGTLDAPSRSGPPVALRYYTGTDPWVKWTPV